jgi:hypothetical protein
MAASKTIKFLPTIFQTDVNEKFLSATLDQLISEPDLQKIYGYIGRTFAPTYKSTDSYIQEPTVERQNYQLEPSVIIKNNSNELTFFSSYPDLLNKINFYGGITDNHNRLFENEYYSFDPLIDYDKFINFSQYYWLQNGPDSVDIFTGQVESNKTFEVSRNTKNNSYGFTAVNGQSPTIILARGGTYTFDVNQLGNNFWIQTELGIDGVINRAPTMSSRDVLGVSNNGTDVGTVTFKVPQKMAQSRFIQMPTTYNVDYTTSAAYSDIHANLVSVFFEKYGGFDGMVSQLNGKTLVFIDQDKLDNPQTYSPEYPFSVEDAWTTKGAYEVDGWDQIPWESFPDYWDRSQFGIGKTVPEADRVSVWQIRLIPASNLLRLSNPVTANVGDQIVQDLSGACAVVTESVVNSNSVKIRYENDVIFTIGTGVIEINGINQTVYPISTIEDDYIIHLDNRNTDGTIRRINTDEKVYVKSGQTNANKEYFRDYDDLLKEVPLVTSNLDTLYYQDGTNKKIYGEIKIVDNGQWIIDVETDILGKPQYTSPNAVIFTNGLKVKFGSDAFPVTYQNNEYYVEGVGESITLTLVDLLVTPESYIEELSAINNTTILPDYILVNRSSVDLNPWARSNRWFHYDVISKTAEYNNTSPIIDQSLRATRPIIEFEPNIRLFNNGKIGKKQIDILDSNTIDAFNSIQGQYITNLYGTELIDGMRIVFANDIDPLVRNKIYVINFVYIHYDINGFPTGLPQINLSLAVDSNVEEYDTIVTVNGSTKGTSWWYNGVSWIQSQQKTSLNQAPLFDVFDDNGNSFSTYTRSSFNGTQIFGYKLSEGPTDTVLGFPLSYRNFDTQGEIEFQNYFDTEALNYLLDNDTINTPINSGVLNKIIDRTTSKSCNVWNTVLEMSKQYQRLSYVYTDTNTFDIVAPADNESSIPYIKVYKNRKFVSPSMWDQDALSITINDSLVSGDIVDVLIYSTSVIGDDLYQLPLNLDYNAQNQDFTSLTLGQLRNHVIELAQNSNNVIGNIVGSNNLRDIQYKKQGGNIIQHSSPVPYSSLFLSNDTSNFISSIRLAQQEYTKFKNKFLELSVSLPGVDPGNPFDSVDLIISKINDFKNNSFSWYYSDMVPYGNNKNVIDAVVFDPLVRTYEISNVFDDSSLSNKSVLVYLNSDPSATYIEGTGIDVEQDILNKLAFVTEQGVVFQNELKIRFGLGVYPSQYQNKNYIVRGVGTGITLIDSNNNVQLVKGRDYTFDQTRPAITITDNVNLDVDYRITIVEYSNTDGNYIPETPTKLGLYPKYIPEVIIDDSYRTTINVIVGHDGSKTPSFGDYRDDFLLELERRIYNNIKVDYNSNSFDIYDAIPGKFRNVNYSVSEFNRVLTTNFLTWIGNNNLNFSINSTFQSNDGFTWNYSQFSDRVDGEKMPGSWRAVYNYFFDTETPHTTPWEMLGFSEKPNWWEGYYGPAPYTGGNELLWDDLSKGLIVDGPRAGIDTRFARPGLLSIIPVNDNGFLKSPVEILTASFNSKSAATSWAIGDQGPVETAWRRSSDYPYAVQIAMALTKPARYFGSLIDTKNYNYDTKLNQYVVSSNKHHIKQTDILINGDTSNNVIYRSAGYINWIADYLKNQGMNPAATLTDLLTSYQVNLSYKVGGYTDQKYLRILAEQYSPTSTNDSIIIPNENYIVQLNKSTPVRKIVYSGVIVEKTTNGYTVRGYDVSNPYFTIIPSVVNNHSYKITVLNDTATIFEDYQNLLITVPYGYEFKTQQQVVDFLISYERFLKAQGFTFNNSDEALGEIQNWTLSCKEFLYWVQQGWTTGSILVLSPIFNSLDVETTGNIVDAITDNTYGSKVLDQNFKMVRNIEYKVMRSPTNFNVTLTNNEVIGLVELSLVQYEHVLVFDNMTVFNDVIYQPELGNRQYRLKLIGQKTANWDGSLSPSGFIYNAGTIDVWNPGVDYLKGSMVQYKSQYYVALDGIPAKDTFEFSLWKQFNYSSMKKGLLPNFSSVASWPVTYYDNYANLVDSSTLTYLGDKTSNRSYYGYGLIGFRPRSYLTDLGLTDSTQLEIYKGFIKQKGTINAVTALTKAQFNDISGQINFYEEWAVRVGEYGSLDNNPWVEVGVDEELYSTNAQVLEFVDSNNRNLSNGKSIISPLDSYKSSDTFNGVIALNRTDESDKTNDIPYAGFVNINDVDTTIFDISNFTDLDLLSSNIGSGYTIWCAKDYTNDWNVFRVTETNNFVKTVSNALDGYISLTMLDHHNLSAGDIIFVKNFNETYDGFYQVYKIVNLNTVIVQYPGTLLNLTTLNGSGILFKLDSLRFQYMENVRTYNPPNGWRDGEKVWVENTAPNNRWSVYEKNTPWTIDANLEKTVDEYQSNDGFGNSIKMNDSSTVIAIGSPNNTAPANGFGTVSIFVKTEDGFSQGTSLFPLVSSTLEYGYALDVTDEYLVVGAPGSSSNNGQVYVYKIDQSTSSFRLVQILKGDTGDKFGSTVQLSRDNLWMYVGAPGTGKVYVYALDSAILSNQSTLTIGPSSSSPISLNWTPSNQYSLLVRGPNIFYVHGVDYTVSGNTITFLTLPANAIDVVVSQEQNFTLINSIVGPGPLTESFGAAIGVSADGAQLAVGAPGANVVVNGVTLTNAGLVYVYDRTIESFKGTGQAAYTTKNEVKAVHRVLVDGTDVNTYTTVVGGTNVSFSDVPLINSTVTVETNSFNLLQTLTGSNPQINSQYGTSLTICSFNCAIYVGSPGFDVSTGVFNNPANESIIPVVNKGTIINSGAVFKNHNQGRLYGTIAGTVTNPTVTVGHSIRLNDFEVTFTGTTLQSVVNDINGKNITGVSASIEATIIGDTYYKNSTEWQDSNSTTITDSLLLNYLNLAPTSKVKIETKTYNKIGGVWYDSQDTAMLDVELVALLNSKSHLRINSQSTLSRNKLRVLSGYGTALIDLGLDIFVQMQIITSPNNIDGERFGTKVSLDTNAHSLIVSSTFGSTIVTTTFDSLTTFDGNSTLFEEPINSSGSAYLFELYDDPRDSVELPGRYAYTQQFNPGNLNSGDQFGWATDIIGSYVLISAPNDSTTVSSGGGVYLFKNLENKNGWEQISTQTDKVDNNSASNLFLYDSVKNVILTNLETIDPAKGKILGQAEQEITYKTVFDPAVYNRGTKQTVNISENNYWDDKQQYQVWWNLNNVRYLDYEQGDLTYRSLNWGSLFPGSAIEVCEWTESNYLPSQYVTNKGDGVPIYADDSAYVEVISVDPVTNAIVIKYYYWVKDKTTVLEVNSSRRLSTSGISNLIEFPSTQGVPYAAIIKDNAVIFYNIGNYLSGTQTILHIDYEHAINENIIHNEVELIRNSPDIINVIPKKIVNKFVDSLSGINSIGQSVPDPKLKESEKYGISIRPRQTMFIDRFAALGQAISYINSVLLKYQLTDLTQLPSLTSKEELPSAALWDLKVPLYDDVFYQDPALPIGFRILVESDSTQSGLWVVYIKDSNSQWQVNRVQAYNTPQYWYNTDWYEQGYEAVTPNYIVTTIEDALKLSYAAGTIVKVLNSGNGEWILIKFNESQNFNYDGLGEYKIIGIQDGTIQISNSVSDYKTGNLGYDNQGFSSARYDQDPAIEVRRILQSLLTENGNTEFKSLLTEVFFILVNYLHTEQSSVDWIFKTSFATVLHQLRSLVQSPNYINDNQTFYEDYINEVKPYKTKIREYILNYDGSDTYSGSVTDFDLPSYYDSNTKTFRSPNGEIPAIDGQLWQTDLYKEWYNNRTYSIGSIVVVHPGTGYTKTPIIEIVSSTGSGATAHAVIDFDTGQVVDIVVDNGGSGYTSQVTVLINGNGYGAAAYPLFAKNQPRGISTTIKFDRINYNSAVLNWIEGTTYTSGDIISYNGAAYQFNYDAYGNSVSYASDTLFDYTHVTPYSSNVFLNSNDRIVGYYTPNIGMPTVDTISETVITANLVSGSNTIYVQSTNIDGNGSDTYINSVSKLRSGMFIGGSGVTAAMITDVVANVEAKVNYIVVDKPQTLSAGAQIIAQYNNLGQLISGVEYPGVQVTGLAFDQNPGYDSGVVFGTMFDPVDYDADGSPTLSSSMVDTNIQSRYTDTLLGTRPEDITVDGGKYIDIYNSHAPEELIPGTVFDALAMKVLTTVNGGVIGYRMVNNIASDVTYYRLSAENETRLVKNFSVDDSYMHLEDALVLPNPNRQLSVPGVVFIGGERITYYRNYAHEVTPWVANISYQADSVVSYGNAITFNTTITANVGDYITQSVTGANAMVVSAANNQSTVYVQKINSNNFVTGIIKINSANDTAVGVLSTAPGYYKTTDTTQTSDFIYSSFSPLPFNNINVITQLRRGTEGTGPAMVYQSGEYVIDASKNQIIPNVAITYNTLGSAETFNVADTPSYILQIEGTITASVGDVISQDFISGAAVTVLNNVENSNYVFVTRLNNTNFVYGNVALSGYGLKVNGTLASNAYPKSMTILGNSIQANGNVVISKDTTVINGKIWNKQGVGVATDGFGLGSGTIGNWTEQEAFLWAQPYR